MSDIIGITMEPKKPQLHDRATYKKAMEAKKLYRQGNTTMDIAKLMSKSQIQIKRYMQMTGGISKEDLGYHYKNRYLKKP